MQTTALEAICEKVAPKASCDKAAYDMEPCDKAAFENDFEKGRTGQDRAAQSIAGHVVECRRQNKAGLGTTGQGLQGKDHVGWMS